MVLLQKILNQLSGFGTAVLFSDEVQAHQQEFEELLATGIVEPVESLQEKLCPTCNAEFVPVQTITASEAYTICTQDESSGRDYFNPQELKQWRLDIVRFLSLFQMAIGIKSPAINENIKGLLWNFNIQEINGQKYHPFFSANIDKIETPKLSIITSLPHSALFYTDTPHIALPDDVVLVPLLDLLKGVNKDSLIADSEMLTQYFPSGVYPTSEGVISLDKTMALQNNTILYDPVRGGTFRKSLPVRPLAKRIIEHLYHIRKYDKNSKTLDELAAGLSSSKSSISNEIKRITELSDTNNLPLILHNYDGERWGINPALSCCR